MSEDVVCCEKRYFGKCPVHGISEFAFDDYKRRAETAEARVRELEGAIQAHKENIQSTQGVFDAQFDICLWSTLAAKEKE